MFLPHSRRFSPRSVFQGVEEGEREPRENHHFPWFPWMVTTTNVFHHSFVFAMAGNLQANVSRQANWGNFPDQYCCTYMLESTDPLFTKIGSGKKGERVL